MRREPALVDDLLDADFQQIGASGRLWTRSEIIAALAADTEPAPIAHTDMAGTLVAPNLVLLTYITHRQGRRVRCSSLWRRTEDVYRLLHHQGTPTQR